MANLPRIVLSLLLALSFPVLAADGFLKPKGKAGELLPVDQAFRFEGLRRDGQTLALQWTVAPGYYLYRHMLKVSADAPAGLNLAEPSLPKGEAKHDAEFGDVEVYRDRLIARIPLAAGAPTPRTLRVRYQGCADLGVCYPPQTKLVAVR